MSNPGGGSGAPPTNLSGTVRHPEKSRAPFHYPRDARSASTVSPPSSSSSRCCRYRWLCRPRARALFSLSQTSSCSTTARFSFLFSFFSTIFSQIPLLRATHFPQTAHTSVFCVCVFVWEVVVGVRLYCCLLLLLWWCISLFVSFLVRSFVSAAINSSGFLLSGRVLIQGQGVIEYGVTDREGAQGGPGGGSGWVGREERKGEWSFCGQIGENNMVATKRSSTHVEFNPKQKGGGGGAGAGGGSSSSSSVVSEGGVVAALIEPLGGFIFVCNNDTMNEDFERHLFGKESLPEFIFAFVVPSSPCSNSVCFLPSFFFFFLFSSLGFYIELLFLDPTIVGWQGFWLNSVCGFCNSGTSAKVCVGVMYVDGMTVM